MLKNLSRCNVHFVFFILAKLLFIFILSLVAVASNRDTFIYNEIIKPSTKENILVVAIFELKHPIDNGAIQVEFSKKKEWKIIKTGSLLELNYYYRGCPLPIQFYSKGKIAIYFPELWLPRFLCNFFGNIAIDINPVQDFRNSLIFSSQITKSDQNALKNLENWIFFAVEEGIWTFGKSTTKDYSLWTSKKPDYVYLEGSSGVGGLKINGILIDWSRANNAVAFRKGENFISYGYDLFVCNAEAKIIKSENPQPFIFTIRSLHITEIF